MKIAFVSSEYPPQTGHGGIGTYTMVTAEALVRSGHRVSVVCLSVTGTKHTYQQNGVTIYRIPHTSYPLYRGRWFFAVRTFCYRFFPQTLIRLCWARAVGHALAPMEKFDVIEFPECVFEGLYLKRSQATLVVRLHTPLWLASRLSRSAELWTDRFLTGVLEWLSIRKAHKISAPSHAMVQRLGKSVSGKKVHVYPNPSQPDLFESPPSPRNRPKQAMYYGRVEYRKGVHLLIDAWQLLDQSQWQLHLIGRPWGTLPDGASYQSLIEKKIAPTSETITWIHGISRPSIPHTLSSYSVAVFPSLWENFPYACMEAMQAGCAIIASDNGGYRQMLGQTALFVPPDNPPKLAEALEKLLKSAQLRQHLAAAAQKRATRLFAPEKIVSEAQRYYDTIQ